MNIADDDQKPRPGKKLSKSLDAIAALRIAMEERLTQTKKEDAPIRVPEQPPASEAPPPKTGEAPKTESAKPASSKPPESGERRTESRQYDPVEWSRIMFRIADRSQKVIQEYLEKQKDKALHFSVADPAHIFNAFMELNSRILSDPERFADAQLALWQGYFKLWQRTLAQMQGRATEPLVTPMAGDKRFMDKGWKDIWLFDFIKQSYLLTSQWAHGLVRQEAARLDPKLAHKIDFYIDQMLDAMSPSNFWLTNPEVLRATIESGGENLVKGLENLLEDLERGHGQLRISMSDNKAFRVGETLATTPGKVIYKNDLMELIQYDPATPNVHRTPLLIIPPWINKFYILDLREKNSFIRHIVAQGYTLFCVSWVNPDGHFANTNFDDYMMDGAIQAMREVKKATGEDEINTVGYCIGGTLLASTLAYLDAAPEKPPELPKTKSATYLVTMVDFSEPGDLGVFIDEDQVEVIEASMAEKGYLDAASMAVTFNMLRANDLIWSFVINNYLLGKEPFPFDILYWNSDSTNLPAAMQSFYLRKMYMENLLCKPNGLSMKDVPIDVSRIAVPSFLLATREDHIAPWHSAYAATQLYKGPVKFVLSGSGHIAGVVNPPAAKKYGYWTNDTCPPEPEDWMKNAAQHHGSWWPEWLKWLEPYAGEKVPARTVRNGIEAAPGSYVLVRTV